MLLLAAALTVATVPRVASYDIRVNLDPAAHRLQGSEHITWRNLTDAPADALWFHLYLNAFAGSDTTFYRESGGHHRSFAAPTDGWGWTHVRSVRVDGGADVASRLTFESPDDGNPADRTVARLPLGSPVPPGGTAEIDLEFDARLPRVFARTGYYGDFHLLGQWFPKLGVFERGADGKVGWNCHQFHQNSEFYADFGDYRVSLSVPDGHVVGASGTEVSRSRSGGRTIVVFAQPAVHDFALVVARDLVETKGTFTDADVPREWRAHAASLLGVAPRSLTLGDVAIRVLTPSRLAPLAPRHLAAAKAALAHYGLAYGAYPYRSLTIVVPPRGADGAGGMEYPTFVTSSGSWRDLVPPGSWRRVAEDVTIHEVGHQWFYGLLASNEFEHAWMDEGFNTYEEYRTLEDVRLDLAPSLRLPRLLDTTPWVGARMFLAVLPQGDAIDTASWKFRSTAEYFLASYDHTALVLRTAANLAGQSRFARAMRAYAQALAFRHPTPADFLAVMEGEIPAVAASFLRRALTTSAPCDFAVAEASATRLVSPGGTLAPSPGGKDVPPERSPAKTASEWENEALVTRPGELVVPVDVELRYADGSRQRRTWDGVKRFDRIRTLTSSPLARVTVDPDHKLLVDRNLLNNTLAVAPSGTARTKSVLDAAGVIVGILETLGWAW